MERCAPLLMARLHAAMASGALRCDDRSDAFGFVHQLSGRDDALHQTDAQRFLCVDDFAGETEIGRHAFADEARRALRAAVAGNEAEIDFRLTELGVLARDEYVAGHRQLAAAAEREAVDRHHDGLTHPLDLACERLAATRLLGSRTGRRERVELADVGARGEGLFARACKDDGTNARILFHLGERRAELVQQPASQCVEDGRAVKHNNADRLVDLDEDIFKLHCENLMVW